MKILVSNDDGYMAPGIQTLVAGLSQFDNYRIHVIAPDRDRSGASNSLTLDRPIMPHTFQYTDKNIRQQAIASCFFMDATPTDCVHIGITGLLRTAPDIVLSGINAGANMGDDVLYSGTIAAATEGRFLGLPAIAVSLDINGHETTSQHPNQWHFQSAARYVLEILQQLKTCPLPEDTILNINVPNLPWEQIKGVQATRLGKRHRSEPAIAAKDPRNRQIFWLGPVGKAADCGPGTDFYAVQSGFISITPLKIDLTAYTLLDDLHDWLQDSKTMAREDRITGITDE